MKVIDLEQRITDLEQRFVESKRDIELLDSYHRQVREIVNRNLKNKQRLCSSSIVRISDSDSVEIKNLYAKIQQVEKLLCSRFGIDTSALYINLNNLKLCKRYIKPLHF